MNELFAIAAAFPALALVAMVLTPTRLAKSRVTRFRRIVTLAAGIQFAVAGSMAVAYAAGATGIIDVSLSLSGASFPLSFSVYYDGVSSLMLTLVSFVGWVICGYSIRYLDGEREQGRYFRWVSFTIGAVSLMVVSGDLLMFVMAWVMTSLGLHQLLLHYGDRPAARRAAWTKFAISRVGDAALLGAVALVYSEFKTLQFGELFAALESRTGDVTSGMVWAAVFLVVGAVTKSAQLPFHSWLPQTMEAPTPVSALMHAGIVNAGGYLIIRTSPLVSLTPWAMFALAIVGATTACFAAVVMLTQTSVKRSLAYSTIAQMGFMMLQCGLGAYSAAMLHILAHSLYKAHAFLSSGTIGSRPHASVELRPSGDDELLAPMAISGSIIVASFAIALAIFGVDVTAKPGGFLLGGIFCLALTHWSGQVMRSGNPILPVRALATAVALCFVYAFSFVAVDQIVAPSLPATITTGSPWLVGSVVVAGFVGLFAIETGLSRGNRPRWTEPLFVHVWNGFYIENHLRRLFGSLASR